MRSLICVAFLLLALWSCGESAAFGRWCAHDELETENENDRVLSSLKDMADPLPTEDTFSPIRITASYLDLREDGQFCSEIGGKVPTFRGGFQYCDFDHDLLNNKKRRLIIDQYIPKAIQLHSDRLLVKRLTTPLMPVPERYFTSKTCKQFTIGRTSLKDGFGLSDFALLVASVPYDSGAAWASPCVDSYEDRPLFGTTVIGTKTVKEKYFFGVRIAAHEIAHALGFSRRFFVAKQNFMLKDVPGRGLDVTLINTPKVREKTREHFNCPTLEGMEMERGPKDTPMGHFSRRSAKDELMSPTDGAALYTALTMAVFEDLGFYKVNWEKAEYMRWGKNVGCDFLDKKCVNEGVTNYEDHFCTEWTPRVRTLRCSTDRLAFSRCALEWFEPDFVEQFRYFRNPKLGGEENGRTEFCPVYEHNETTTCIEKKSAQAIPFGVFDKNSRCFDVKDLMHRESNYLAICVSVKCETDSYQIQYKKDGNFVDCPVGQEVEIVPDKVLKGRIVCPPYEEVCVLKAPY